MNKPPTFLGIHVDCGGNVHYHATRSFAYRACDKCKANGMYGTKSPDVVPSKV